MIAKERFRKKQQEAQNQSFPSRNPSSHNQQNNNQFYNQHNGDQFNYQQRKNQQNPNNHFNNQPYSYHKQVWFNQSRIPSRHPNHSAG